MRIEITGMPPRWTSLELWDSNLCLTFYTHVFLFHQISETLSLVVVLLQVTEVHVTSYSLYIVFIVLLKVLIFLHNFIFINIFFKHTQNKNFMLMD